MLSDTTAASAQEKPSLCLDYHFIEVVLPRPPIPATEAGLG